MKYGARWVIDDEKKNEYINNLLPQLATLRARVGVSQDELASLVGISRQTYCLTESGSRSMSWNTFLSIIMFYDYNNRTHDLIRSIGAFPDDLFYQFNLGESGVSTNLQINDGTDINKMISEIDEDGLRAIKAIVAAEHARCMNSTNDEMLYSFSDLVKQKPAAPSVDIHIRRHATRGSK